MRSLFILELTYKKPISEVEKYLDQHKVYLKKYYQSENFICSGRKNPRTGGIILSTFESLDQVNEIIKDDPFFQQAIAEYSVTEFIPTMTNPNFNF